MEMLTFNFHIGDFAKKTNHLSMIEKGVYLNLLMHYYDHEQALPKQPLTYRLANARDQIEKEAVDFVLSYYFIETDLGFINKRCDEEIQIYREKSQKAKKNGRLGGLANAKQTLSECSSDRLANHEPLTTNHEPLLKPMSSKLDSDVSHQIANDFIKQAKGLLDHLNRKTNRKYEPVKANIKPIVARLKEYSVGQLFSIIDNKCAQWLNDENMSQYLRPATLFNASKCAQYAGEIGSPRVSEKPWFLVNSKIEAYGEAKGIEKGTDWQLYKKQVLTSYGITVEQYKQAVAEWTKK